MNKLKKYFYLIDSIVAPLRLLSVDDFGDEKQLDDEKKEEEEERCHDDRVSERAGDATFEATRCSFRGKAPLIYAAAVASGRRHGSETARRGDGGGSGCSEVAFRIAFNFSSSFRRWNDARASRTSVAQTRIASYFSHARRSPMVTARARR